MIRLIEAKSDELIELCRRYNVRRLDVFGSAVGSRFDDQTSDLDFLVEFLPLEQGRYADCYFGLLFGLEELLGRKVDLVTDRAIRNPYFRQSVDATRRLIYAATGAEAAV